jgi:hypothetical protein
MSFYPQSYYNQKTIGLLCQIVYKKATIVDPTFSGTVNGITKSMVGLSNVDNTSDINKPISVATQNALGLKAPLINPTFVGTVNGITKSMVGLANVDNTSDINKPISAATQTELELKAPLINPTFVGTVNGITKEMVGLSNVDNTSDINKPISVATQNALGLKAPISNPSFTGTLTYSTLGNVISITNGGTGSSTRQGALNALTGSFTDKHYLRGDGTNMIMSPLLFTDLVGVINVNHLYNVTLSETHSNSLVITENTGSPFIPENLPNGFTCTIFNYSIFPWISNTLASTKFYTNTSGPNGLTSITIPECGSITLFSAIKNGITYYIVK